MNESDHDDDALDALLRAGAPEPLLDDGFVLRTMAAVDQAARRLPVQRRQTPVAPIVIARALVAENRRHAAQARRWRWVVAGVIVGSVMMLVAMAASPGSASIEITAPSQWGPLGLLMTIGALAVAWRELRNT